MYFIMDDEVYIWPLVPFEYHPIITILLDLLSSYFVLNPLFFKLWELPTIQSALILAEFAPIVHKSSPDFSVNTAHCYYAYLTISLAVALWF